MQTGSFSLQISVRRHYVAAIAACAYVFAHRAAAGDARAADIALAFAKDASLLLGLYALFALTGIRIRKESFGYRANTAMHFGLALAATAVVAGAQILYEKTGEVLDADILFFFFRHLAELKGTTASVLDGSAALTLFVCLGLFSLSLIVFTRSFLTVLQRVLFSIPIGLLLLNLATSVAGNESGAIGFEPKNALYLGRYANFNEIQKKWLEDESPAGRRGIISEIIPVFSSGSADHRITEALTSYLPHYVPPTQVTPPTVRPNIVFVLLESTRALSTGIYNGAAASDSHTPFLDSLARNARVYDHAYTTIPHTSKALVGIYCGTFGEFGTGGFESTTSPYPFACLPKVLANFGYQTAHFQTAPGDFEGRSRALVNLGFAESVLQENLNAREHQHFGYLGLDDRLLIAPMLTWMRERRDHGQPFLASLLTVLTHHPYVSPGNVEPVQDTNTARENYHRAVRYVDDLLRDLIGQMEKHRLLENTIVVITGDHGEAFGEHGQIAHNGVAYEEGMHVPLIVYSPDLLPGHRRIAGLRQHIDILPGFLDLLGMRHDGVLPGRNLFADESGHDEIITACFYERYCLNHYRSDRTKLIYFYGKRKTELYDLASDPSERRNLSAISPPEGTTERLRRAVALQNSYARSYEAKPKP